LPSLGDYTLIREQLATDIPLAWTDVTKIYFGKPLAPKAGLPYAVVDLTNPDAEMLTVRGAVQTYDFTIYCVEVKNSENLLDQAIVRQNSLAPLLEANETYATVGMNPLVYRFDLDLESESDGYLISALHFKILVRRDWGS